MFGQFRVGLDSVCVARVFGVGVGQFGVCWGK